MKLTSLISLALLTVVLILVFAPAPGAAVNPPLQPTSVEITGRVAKVGPTFDVYGIQLSLLYVRSGGMIYTLNCFSEACRQVPRGTKVVVDARLWSDFAPGEDRTVLSLDVVSLKW